MFSRTNIRSNVLIADSLAVCLCGGG